MASAHGARRDGGVPRSEIPLLPAAAAAAAAREQICMRGPSMIPSGSCGGSQHPAFAWEILIHSSVLSCEEIRKARTPE